MDERIERLDDLKHLLKKGDNNLTEEEREYVKKTLEQIGFSLGEDMIKKNPHLKLTKDGLISGFAQFLSTETSLSKNNVL